MIEILMENLGTAAVSLALAGIVSAIVVKLIRDKKKGGCAGCGCAGCPARQDKGAGRLLTRNLPDRGGGCGIADSVRSE